jgi:methylenetetrahydromethanopterin dehydrogenase
MLIVVAKTGNIGSSLVLELLLDERADRKDIDVRVVSSGAKMSVEEGLYVAEKTLELNPDLIIYATPNASAKGPRIVVESLRGRNAIIVSDSPAVKLKDTIEKDGLGYILITADAMIGARREFLDPTEMGIFNADILKILGGTGVIRLIQIELGKTISALKTGRKYLPRVVVTGDIAIRHANFKGSKAKEKALSAYIMAEKVGKLNVRGCFMEKDPKEYIKTVAQAHNTLRKASIFVDEAREIEKTNDTLYRTPHNSDGRILKKSKLFEKPN